MTPHTSPPNRSICNVGDMTEPRTRLPRTSANATFAARTETIEAEDVPAEGESSLLPAEDSPPRTPTWVKALGIILVVLLLAFAGLHLTGNAPTHMTGPGGAQHGLQLP